MQTLLYVGWLTDNAAELLDDNLGASKRRAHYISGYSATKGNALNLFTPGKRIAGPCA
jgi:hypothetical protein